MSPATQTRELASREGHGIHVTLLWHPSENALTVSVEDARAGRASSSRSRPTAPSTPSTTPTPTRPEGGTRNVSHHAHAIANLAARMGRWSAAHWKTATFGWLAFVLVAFGLGGMVGTRNIDQNTRAGRVRPHGQDPRGRLQAARRARTS